MDIGTWELLSYIVTTIGLPARDPRVHLRAEEGARQRGGRGLPAPVGQLSGLPEDRARPSRPALVHARGDARAHRRAARAHADHLQHADLAVRARVPAALRAEDDVAAAAPLAVVGGLHARVVQARATSARCCPCCSKAKTPSSAPTSARSPRRTRRPTRQLSAPYATAPRRARARGRRSRRSASRDCLRGRRTRTSGSSGRGSAAAPRSTAPCRPSDP